MPGLADLLIGRITSIEHGAKNLLNIDNWYLGLYAQDSWRISPRLTLNFGMRWEPYFGQNVLNNAVSIFDMDNFQQGIKSKVFLNAPAGLIYPGDEGFPAGADRTEQAVVEPVAARRVRVGRSWRRPSVGAFLVRHGLRLHVRRVPQHQRWRATLRQPIDSSTIHPG